MEATIYNLGHQDDQILSLNSGTTIDETEFEGEIDKSYCPSQDVTIVVSCDYEDSKLGQEKRCRPKRFFWIAPHSSDYITSVWNDFFFYDGLEDYSDTHSEAISTMQVLPANWNQHEMEINDFRGTYAPTYRRKVLFTKTLELKISELARWKPTAIIGKRDFEVENVQ